jgi:hypothetical protein
VDRNDSHRMEALVKRSAILGLTTLAVLLAASAFAGSTPAASRMILRASDLPPGFMVVRSETGLETNDDLVRKNGAALAPKLRRWGRVTGYRVFYRQRDPARGALPGVIGFGATVSLFRTASGAHAALAAPGGGCRHRDFTLIGLGGNRPVGPATLVCTRVLKVRRGRLRFFLVQWRNGRAAGAVYVLTADGAVTPLAALTGARKQNRRMTAQLSRG